MKEKSGETSSFEVYASEKNTLSSGDGCTNITVTSELAEDITAKYLSFAANGGNEGTKVTNEKSNELATEKVEDLEEMKRKERIKKAKQKQLEVCQRLKKKQSPSDEPNPLCNIKGDTTFAWQEAHEDSTKNTMSYDSNQENNLLVEDDEEFWSKLTQMQTAANISGTSKLATNANVITPCKQKLNGITQLDSNITRGSSNKILSYAKENSHIRLQVPENPYRQTLGSNPTPKRPKRTSSSNSLIASNASKVARSSPRFYKGNKRRSPLTESNLEIG